MFSCEIWEIFKNTYFEEHQRTTASIYFFTVFQHICPYFHFQVAGCTPVLYLKHFSKSQVVQQLVRQLLQSVSGDNNLVSCHCCEGNLCQNVENSLNIILCKILVTKIVVASCSICWEKLGKTLVVIS